MEDDAESGQDVELHLLQGAVHSHKSGLKLNTIVTIAR